MNLTGASLCSAVLVWAALPVLAEAPAQAPAQPESGAEAPAGTPAAIPSTPRIVQAALLAVGRLYGRYDAASFAELGSVDSTIGGDVDLRRLLGLNRRPVLG